MEINKSNGKEGLPESEKQSSIEKFELDPKREEAYKKLDELIEEYSASDYLKLKQSLVSIAKTVNPDAKLIPLDLEGLSVVDYSTENANEVAGKRIDRRVIMFNNLGSYRRLANAMNQPSDGMNLSFSQGPYAGASLIVASPNKYFINHEIMHSIDPNLLNREGVNQLLGEVFTFYNQSMIEGFNGFNIEEDDDEKRWKLFIFQLNSYYESFGKDTPKEEYKEIVRKIIAKLKDMREKLGDIQTQRIIANSKTINDLLERKVMPNYNETFRPDSGVGVGSRETVEQRAARLGANETGQAHGAEEETGGEQTVEEVDKYKSLVAEANQLLDEYLLEDSRKVVGEDDLDHQDQDFIEATRRVTQSARDSFYDELKNMDIVMHNEYDSKTKETRIIEHGSMIKETIQRLAKEFASYGDYSPQGPYNKRAEQLEELASKFEV